MILDHNDYRAYLKAEFAQRANANSRYSLRAFARALGISAPFLSQVLQGKKSLSGEYAFKLSSRLHLNEDESRYFSLLVQYEAEKNPTDREALETKLRALNPKRKTRDLSLDVFRAISDWYHFAILELTLVPGFALSARTAAQRLHISMAEADVAIDRLQRLELLEKRPNGRLKKAEQYVITQSSTSNGALQSFHSQLLAKASDALKTQTPEERISSSDLVSFARKDLRKVKELSDRFTSELVKISDNTPSTRKDVYCLSVHFFNLTPSPRSSK